MNQARIEMMKRSTRQEQTLAMPPSMTQCGVRNTSV
jgi:hypothetical protein